jgi:hypothetical protein
MNIVADILLKGIIGGLGNTLAKTVMLMIEAVAKPEYLAQLIMHLARAIAKKTKTEEDDKLVGALEKIFIKEGLLKN